MVRLFRVHSLLKLLQKQNLNSQQISHIKFAVIVIFYQFELQQITEYLPFNEFKNYLILSIDYAAINAFFYDKVLAHSR